VRPDERGRARDDVRSHRLGRGGWRAGVRPWLLPGW
jgi:hypothetical protein